MVEEFRGLRGHAACLPASQPSRERMNNRPGKEKERNREAAKERQTDRQTVDAAQTDRQ